MAEEELRKSLIEKGWSPDEVEKALSILYKEETPKAERHRQKMNRVLYWSTLILVIIANTIVSIVMVPFLLVLPHFFLYFVIAVLGLTFGALFDLLVRDIENIDPTHHVIAGIFLPAIAIINIYVMVNFSNRFNEVMKISMITQNPVVVSIVYVVAFLFPYLFDQIFFKKVFRKETT